VTKPKHVKYLEEFSEKIDYLNLRPGDIVGSFERGKKNILLYFVEDGERSLPLSSNYVELGLGYGNPTWIESAFLIREDLDVDSPKLEDGAPIYKVNEGSDLHNYGSVISGMDLPEGSIIPLTESRTLGSIVRKLENCGLNCKKN